MASPPVDAAAAPSARAAAFAAQIVDRSCLSAFAFLLWEIIITFPDEVEHIWSKPHTSATKWAFIGVRYIGLFVCFAIQASGAGHGYGTRIWYQPNCEAWVFFQNFSLQIMILFQQFLMSQRVYALYGRPRALLFILAPLFVAEQLAMLASNLAAVPHIRWAPDCTSLSVPSGVAVFGGAPVALDLLLLGLTLARGIAAARARGGWARAPLLLRALMRDGAGAFFAVGLAFGVNGLFYLAIDGPLSATAWAWQFALCACVPCRVVLRMYAHAEHEPAGTSAPAQSVALTTFHAAWLADDEEPPDSAYPLAEPLACERGVV